MTEKLEIANYTEQNLLTRRTKIIVSCLHRRKFKQRYLTFSFSRV